MLPNTYLHRKTVALNHYVLSTTQNRNLGTVTVFGLVADCNHRGVHTEQKKCVALEPLHLGGYAPKFVHLI